MTKHAGRSFAIGRENVVYAQLKKVNGMNREKATNYLREAFSQHKVRSQFEWTVDISYIKTFLK